jgi:hypothetical protein
MKKTFLPVMGLLALMSCSKSGGPGSSEVWPKYGVLLTTFADVGQTKKDTVYIKSANFPEKRAAGDLDLITDKESLWTVSTHSDGSGQESYVLIKNDDGDYMRIDSIGSPLGAKEFIVETGKPSGTPGKGYRFVYYKDGNGFRLESLHRRGYFVTSEGHSYGGNGLEFKSSRAGEIFWIHSK